MASEIYPSTYAPLAIPDMSIPQFMLKYNPDNVPATKEIHTDTISGKSISYGGIRSEAAKCAYGLRHKLGMRVDDVVFCLIPNSTDFLLLAHSVWWAGGVFSSQNPASTPNEIAHALKLVRPKFVCVATEYLDNVRAAIKQSGLAPAVLTVLGQVEGLQRFPEAFVARDALPPFDPKEHGLTGKTARAVINFSSGTTGSSKAVALSHYGLIATTLMMRASCPVFVNSGTREVFFPPYCHIYGVMMILMNGAWLGNFNCAMHKFDLEEYCRLNEKHQANFAHLVPPVAIALANMDVVKKYDLSHLEKIVVAAAPVKKDLQMRIKARFGQKCKIAQAYGMTECPVVTHSLDLDDESEVGSVGRPLSGVDIRLVDPVTLQDVQEGTEGELWVRSPHAMMGYVNDAEATKAAFSADGEWVRTGDILVRDMKGCLWVTDRLKEMIKYKGLQIAPSELEGVLLRHPDVTDAAVCSTYDDEQATELPVAFVALRGPLPNLPVPEKQEVLDRIRNWVDGEVASYKKVRGGVFHLQNLPKTASGKILRKDLPTKRLGSRFAKI